MALASPLLFTCQKQAVVEQICLIINMQMEG